MSLDSIIAILARDWTGVHQWVDSTYVMVM